MSDKPQMTYEKRLQEIRELCDASARILLERARNADWSGVEGIAANLAAIAQLAAIPDLTTKGAPDALYPKAPSLKEVRVSRYLPQIADGIEDALLALAGERYGFALFVFPFLSAEANGSYISNAERADMVNVIPHILSRLDKDLPTPPLHDLKKYQ